MREKLIELLDDIQRCGEGFDDYEIYGMRLPNTVCNDEVADHLIANGVTFAKDNNVPSKWIPVTERKPDLELVEVKNQGMDLFPCLVSKVSQGQCRQTVVTKAWWDGLHFMDSDCIYITKYVTHWMPLPQPPKEGWPWTS